MHDIIGDIKEILYDWSRGEQFFSQVRFPDIMIDWMDFWFKYGPFERMSWNDMNGLTR